MNIKNKVLILKVLGISLSLYALYVLIFITYKFINWGLYLAPAMFLIFVIVFGYNLFKYSNKIVIWIEST